MISIQDSKVKHLNYVRFISILAGGSFDTSNENRKIITEILTGMEKVEREVKTETLNTLYS